MSPDSIRKHLVTSELSCLADQLDAVILFFGDYRSAHQAITRRKIEVMHSADYRLLIYSGVIAGALDDSDALDYFDNATKCAESKTDSYAAQHRAATFEIKRQSRLEEGAKRLAQAKKRYIDEETPEGQLDLAIMHNLVALTYLQSRDGSPDSSLQSANEHLTSFMNAAATNVELASRAGRYSSQVAINTAQLRVFSENAGEAARILKTNLDTARRRAFDYLPEALGEYAYSLYLIDNHKSAIRYATEAFWRYQQIGAIQGIRASRNIVTACLYKQNSLDEAEHIAELSETDPLGIQGLDNLV